MLKRLIAAAALALALAALWPVTAARYEPTTDAQLVGPRPSCQGGSAVGYALLITAANTVGCGAVSGGGSSTVLPVGQVRLVYSSSTALLVKPFNGNLINVNGAYVTVPSAGVTCSNTGLAYATLYYAYVFLSGSTLTCEMVTTAHATGASNGVEIKSGDGTRTYVGMAYTAGTSGTGTFADTPYARTVASWFNRPARQLASNGNASPSTASSNFVTLSATLAVQVLTHADEVADTDVVGYVYNDTAGAYPDTALSLDGAQTGQITRSQAYTANAVTPVTDRLTAAPGEGLHTLNAAGRTNGGGTSYWTIQLIGAVR